MIQLPLLQIPFANHVESHNVLNALEVPAHHVLHHILSQEIVVSKHCAIHHVPLVAVMPILVPLVQHSTLLQAPPVQPVLVTVIHAPSSPELTILLHVLNVKMDIIWFNKPIIKSLVHHAVQLVLDI